MRCTRTSSPRASHRKRRPGTRRGASATFIWLIPTATPCPSPVRCVTVSSASGAVPPRLLGGPARRRSPSSSRVAVRHLLVRTLWRAVEVRVAARRRGQPAPRPLLGDVCARVAELLQSTCGGGNVGRELESNYANIWHPMDELASLVGDSPQLEAVRRSIRRVVARDHGGQRLPAVLIQGETGTGKGLVASILHRLGPRSRGPFIDINCAAIPDTLLEAELFGYEQGAFTDARRAKAG